MAKTNFKKCWQELKENKINHFTTLYYNAVENPEDLYLTKLANREIAELKAMDKMDGTHDFENVLHVLKRRNK